MNLLESALQYAKAGFHVFPLKPGGKEPIVAGGLKAATTDPDQIKLWWQKTPNANIGIRTGAISGITVVDYDSEDAYLSHRFGSTLTVKTPKGYHEYFSYEPSLGQTTGLFGKGSQVDVRNDNGYVVGPGSTGYRLHNEEEISTLPPYFIKEREVVPKTTHLSDDIVVEGSRNDYLTTVAGALVRKGIKGEALESIVRNVNEEVCNPPLDDTEVDKIVGSLNRYDPDPEEDLGNAKPVPASEYLPSMVDYLKDPNKVVGLSTGIKDLDKLMGGGYREGELVAIHAPAKTGKSTFVRKLVHSLVSRGVHVGYASREEYPDKEVIPALLSIETGKSVFKADVDQGRYQEILSKWPLYFSPGYGKFPQFGRWLENCKEAGCEIVFVDHLHFMTSDEDYKEAVRVMHEAIKMAKTLSICVVMIIQPKNVFPDQELGMDTLRGGAGIGQAITMLLTMERLKDKAGVSKISLKAKRHPTAKIGHFFFECDEESLDMYEVVEVAPDIPQGGGLNDPPILE